MLLHYFGVEVKEPVLSVLVWDDWHTLVRAQFLSIFTSITDQMTKCNVKGVARGDHPTENDPLSV